MNARFFREATLSLCVGTAVGFLVWALSPLISGQTEPWDAPGLLCVWISIGWGIVSVLYSGKSSLLGILGYFVGQWLFVSRVYEPSLPLGDPQILSVYLVIAAIGVIPALLSAAAGQGLKWLLFQRRRFNQHG